MLTQEETNQYLQTERISNWLQLCLSDINANLSAELQPIAYALLDHDEHGKQYANLDTQVKWEQYEQAIERNLQLLSDIDPDKRIAIFSALLPRLASTLEATWQLLGQRNYQSGHLFRAPGDDEATFPMRTSWLQ